MTASSNFSPNWRSLAPAFYSKVWGTPNLEPWFPARPGLTGEVWFPPVASILVKFLFTAQKLSVQVHPGGSTGKTEMWHILRAAPGAAVALGFARPVTPAEVRDACLSGQVESLLRWFPARPGDVYFVPAGTVHALGPGLALCEIQQCSDVTYRLYDYGRPRELHLDQALEVSRFDIHPGPASWPVRCPYFETERLDISAGGAATLAPRPESLVVFASGQGSAAGTAYRAGEVWSTADALEITAAKDTVVLRAAPPSHRRE